jgi:hypothetical protein
VIHPGLERVTGDDKRPAGRGELEPVAHGQDEHPSSTVRSPDVGGEKAHPSDAPVASLLVVVQDLAERLAAVERQ